MLLYIWIVFGFISVIIDYQNTKDGTWEIFDIVTVGLAGPIFLIVHILKFLWSKYYDNSTNV